MWEENLQLGDGDSNLAPGNSLFICYIIYRRILVPRKKDSSQSFGYELFMTKYTMLPCLENTTSCPKKLDGLIGDKLLILELQR